jgi:hypothetical protein
VNLSGSCFQPPAGGPNQGQIGRAHV